jgi:hypothetical protein
MVFLKSVLHFHIVVEAGQTQSVSQSVRQPIYQLIIVVEAGQTQSVSQSGNQSIN